MTEQLPEYQSEMERINSICRQSCFDLWGLISAAQSGLKTGICQLLSEQLTHLYIYIWVNEESMPHRRVLDAERNTWLYIYIYIYKLNLQIELFRPLRSRQCSSEWYEIWDMSIAQWTINTSHTDKQWHILFLNIRVLKLKNIGQNEYISLRSHMWFSLPLQA